MLIYKKTTNIFDIILFRYKYSTYALNTFSLLTCTDYNYLYVSKVVVLAVVLVISAEVDKAKCEPSTLQATLNSESYLGSGHGQYQAGNNNVGFNYFNTSYKSFYYILN